MERPFSNSQPEKLRRNQMKSGLRVRLALKLTHVLPLIRPLGFPIYVARVPSAPFIRFLRFSKSQKSEVEIKPPSPTSLRPAVAGLWRVERLWRPGKSLFARSLIQIVRPHHHATFTVYPEAFPRRVAELVFWAIVRRFRSQKY